VNPAAPAPDQRQGGAVHQDRLAEWANGRLYRSHDERLAALPGWINYHNAEPTHTALGGITPRATLVNNLRGNHS
jgi:hypothetical protein